MTARGASSSALQDRPTSEAGEQADKVAPRWERPALYELAALVGFLGAAAGLVAAIVGVMNRGGWGFLTSGTYLRVVVGCLLGASALSWWASTWTDGGWKVLAWAGMATSVCALAVVVAVAAAAMVWVTIIRSWALTRGFALHPGTRNRDMIRYTRTQHRSASRQVNDHGRVSGTHVCPEGK